MGASPDAVDRGWNTYGDVRKTDCVPSTLFGVTATMDTTLNTETETKWTEVKAWIDGLSDTGRANLLQRLKEMRDEPKQEGLLSAYRDEFELNVTLNDLAQHNVKFQFFDGETFYYRDPTDEEWAEVVHPGKSIKFAVRWTYDGPEYDERFINEKDWKAGKRWTLERFATFAHAIYSANRGRRIKEMGDHRFFEGFAEDGTMMMGS